MFVNNQNKIDIKQKIGIHLTKAERFVFIALSILLVIGAVILKNSCWRASSEIVLKEAEQILCERRKINLNTVTFYELILVPGIGETLAARMIDCRTNNRRFYSEDDLLMVKGMGKKKLEKIREYIKFD